MRPIVTTWSAALAAAVMGEGQAPTGERGAGVAPSRSWVGGVMRLVFAALMGFVWCSTAAADIVKAYVVADDELFRYALDRSWVDEVLPMWPPIALLDVRSIAFSPTGELIGLDDNHRLVLLDQSTGAVTPLVALDRWGAGIAFDDGGQLWLGVDADLFVVDLNDGTTTLIGSLEPPASILAIAFHQGELYSTNGWGVFRIDRSTLAATLVADFNPPGGWGWELVMALSSDGVDLWAATLRGGEPGQERGYNVVAIDVYTGEQRRVAYCESSGEFFSYLALAVQPRGPRGTAIPTVTPLGALAMVVLVVGSGVVLLRRRW